MLRPRRRTLASEGATSPETPLRYSGAVLSEVTDAKFTLPGLADGGAERTHHLLQRPHLEGPPAALRERLSVDPRALAVSRIQLGIEDDAQDARVLCDLP